MSEESVEGEWKDFVFKMAKPEDNPRVLEILRKYFYPHEVLCSMICSTEKELNLMAKDFELVVEGVLSENLSFLAEDKKTGKLAGVRLSSLTLKGEKLEPLNYSFKPNEVVINFLTKASNQAKIFDIYPDIDRYADFFMTCTSPEFRGQGLATEMYIRAIRLFQSKELKVCKSILTSIYTLKACRGLNFTENCTLFLKDYKDEQGNLYFPNATDQSITVVSKRI